MMNRKSFNHFMYCVELGSSAGGGGRGIVCRSEVSPETVVLRLPLHLLITDEHSRLWSSVGRLMAAEELRGEKMLKEVEDVNVCGQSTMNAGSFEAAEVFSDDHVRKEAATNSSTVTSKKECHDGIPSVIEEGDETLEIFGLDVSAPLHCYLAVFILEDRCVFVIYLYPLLTHLLANILMQQSDL
jgi:hypothetical protein